MSKLLVLQASIRRTLTSLEMMVDTDNAVKAVFQGRAKAALNKVTSVNAAERVGLLAFVTEMEDRIAHIDGQLERANVIKTLADEILAATDEAQADELVLKFIKTTSTCPGCENDICCEPKEPKPEDVPVKADTTSDLADIAEHDLPDEIKDILGALGATGSNVKVFAIKK